MKDSHSITEISKQIKSAAAALGDFCKTLPDEQFFFQPEGKWSAAQQVKHLTTATNTARLALIISRWLLRLVGGKPNRPSRNYDELVAKYKLKLAQGARQAAAIYPNLFILLMEKKNCLNVSPIPWIASLNRLNKI